MEEVMKNVLCNVEAREEVEKKEFALENQAAPWLE